MTTTRRSVAFEVAALGAVTLVFVATFTVRPAYADFLLAGAAVALILLSAKRSQRLWALAFDPPEAPRARYRAMLLVIGIFTTVALLVLAATALVLASHPEAPTAAQRFGNWHLLLAAALYFPWALLQQYIFQFYLFGRLLRLVPVPFAIAITALAFSCVHYPRWPVMALTAVAGSVWSVAYYRYRQLLPLALSHALLGAALHYWVFAHDLLEAWLP
jgi:membrane protease YdiL (CAAX protease family)